MAHEPRVVPGLALVFAAVFLARCPPAVQAQSCESSVGGGCWSDDCCAGMYCDGWYDWCVGSSTPMLIAAPLTQLLLRAAKRAPLGRSQVAGRVLAHRALSAK